MRACDPLFLILMYGRNVLRTCPLCWLSGSPRVLTALWGREWRDSNPDRQEGNLEVGRNVVTPAFGCSWFCPGGLTWSHVVHQAAPILLSFMTSLDPGLSNEMQRSAVSWDHRKQAEAALKLTRSTWTWDRATFCNFFYIFCWKGSGIFSS